MASYSNASLKKKKKKTKYYIAEQSWSFFILLVRELWWVFSYDDIKSKTLECQVAKVKKVNKIDSIDLMGFVQSNVQCVKNGERWSSDIKGIFVMLYTGVVGGILFNSKKTFAKPIKTSLQSSYNTEKEAVSSAEVKLWLLENKQKKGQTHF